MKKLHLNPDELRVETFRTTAEDTARQGTVRAHGAFTPFTDGNVGYSTGDCVCACDTTYTQRAPECDPSAETFCFDAGCGGDV